MIAPVRSDRAGERATLVDARRTIVESARPAAAETIALADACGRILATSLVADDDLVPFARSAMDGYAVRAAETREAATRPIVLPVAGTLFAGGGPALLEPRTAIAIATGAALPDGADAVIPFEDVAVRDGSIVVSAQVRSGDHLFVPGDDARRGEVYARQGDVITPGRAALLASAGQTQVAVHRRPRAAVLCTGDELVDVAERPPRGRIRDSNATMLRALLQQDGAHVIVAERVRDEREALRAALAAAIASCDVVITTGGASTGERDFVKEALTSLGAAFAFRSVALRPAKPTAFARCGDALVAVLPGNPAAAFVGYTMLAGAGVRRIAGARDPIAPWLTARLRGAVHARADRHYVVFARVLHEDGELVAVPLENQCSSLVRTPADADALIVVPPGERDHANGAAVPVQMLR